MTQKVAVLGAGRFGLAFSKLLFENNNDVYVWGLNQEICDCATLEANSAGIDLTITPSLQDVLEGSKYVFIAVNAQNVRNMLEVQKEKLLKNNHIFVSLVKGVEISTSKFIDDVIQEVLGISNEQVVAIAGPNLASDVISGDKVGITISEEGRSLAKELFNFGNESESKRLNPEIDFAERLAIELVGTAKNVYAIGCGFLKGQGQNSSGTSTLLTKISNELECLVFALLEARGISDAFEKAKTVVRSFAGFGDLVLTCTSEKSRNFTFGFLRAKGKTSAESLKEINSTVEGEASAKTLIKIAKQLDVSVPVLEFAASLVD